MWVLAPTQDRISELSLRSGCCCCVLPPACAGELVAVKAVDATRFHSISEIEQVQEEMAVLAQLRHPNIIRLQEVVFAGGCFYFMMEYASGGSLAGHLAAQPGGRLGEAAAREVFGGILAALEYCHKRCAARVVLRVVQCAWLLKPLLLLCAGVLRQTVVARGAGLGELRFGWWPFVDRADACSGICVCPVPVVQQVVMQRCWQTTCAREAHAQPVVWCAALRL